MTKRQLLRAYRELDELYKFQKEINQGQEREIRMKIRGTELLSDIARHLVKALMHNDEPARVDHHIREAFYLLEEIDDRIKPVNDCEKCNQNMLLLCQCCKEIEINE